MKITLSSSRDIFVSKPDSNEAKIFRELNAITQLQT